MKEKGKKIPELNKRLEKIRYSNKKTVLYVVEDIEAAQYRYRCKNVTSIMNEGNWQIVPSLTSEIEKFNELLRRIDLVVVVRQAEKNGSVSRFIDLAHTCKVKIIFDLDDLVFDFRDLPILMKATGGKNFFAWAGYIYGIRVIAKKADGFFCTNEFLAEKLKRSFNKPVKIIRNSLNKEQIEVSEKWVKKKHEMREVNKAIERPGGFRIGYFSGSPTHIRDFQLVEDELVSFLDKYKDATLKVVGYMKFSKRMRSLINEGRVEATRPVDYLRLQGLMSKVDVNIAPLVINDFTNCKSELKFFEAAAVETTTIASPTYAFKKAISNGENGYLAKPGEWYDKLEHLYQHPKENRRAALAANEYALKHYYGKEFLDEVEAAYDFFAK